MRFHLLATVVSLALTADALPARAQANKSPGNKTPANEPLADKAADNQPAEDALADDLKLLQGTWELLHGNEGKGPPTIRSVKEIKDNRETLRRYDLKTGKQTREHSVDFVLSRSGEVRVCTFYPVDGDPKQGLSFVYKVDAENFYDIPGLLDGQRYRNYQEAPRVWHWKRIKDTIPAEAPADSPAPSPQKPEQPQPPPKIPAALQTALESLGARVTARADGYSIDIRRKPGFRDSELDLVVQCPQVVDLTLERVSITDQGLAKLRALPELKRLILNETPISAKGLAILADLPFRESLFSLGLRGTKIKDDDLTILKDFPRLERLDVSQTGLTDASLPAVQTLPLKVLTVSQTPFSKAALDELQQKYPKLILNR